MAGKSIIVMGVCGSGKSSIGLKVASALGAKFIDGDDLHPRANIQKMAGGNPLNDEDRAPWLERIRDAAYSLEQKNELGVIVCSALKKQYRDQNPRGQRIGAASCFWTAASPSFSNGCGHGRATSCGKRMVKSQFETLERPDGEPGVFSRRHRWHLRAGGRPRRHRPDAGAMSHFARPAAVDRARISVLESNPMTHPVITEVTNRIRERSVARRQAFLARIQRQTEQGKTRASLSCGNLAHAVAASSCDDKGRILDMTRANVAIVTAYNDMLSAHQPYQGYPDIIKGALAGLGHSAQVAGGVPAMCDGVTQGQPGMDMSLFSRDTHRPGHRGLPLPQHLRRHPAARHL